MKIIPSYIPLQPQDEISRRETLKQWQREYNEVIKSCLKALDQDGLTYNERRELVEGIKAFKKVVADIEKNLL